MTRGALAFLVLLPVSGCHRDRAPIRDETEPPPITRAKETASSASAAPVAESAPQELTWRYESTPLGPSEVVVLVPGGASDGRRFPVLVAFHGRGESLKGPHAGARGWADDYGVRHAEDRLRAPPLTGEDFLGWVKPERLVRMNQSLSAKPFQGMILVCPYLPDALHGGRMLEEGRALAHFVVDEVLTRVKNETPALREAVSTSVDGVSLGGRAALLVGLLRPDAFHTVSAMQPAIDEDEVMAITNLALEAQTKNPGLAIRLLSSDGDYFLQPTVALHETLNARGGKSQLSLVLGPHSYEFNRGPGAHEMLYFHDRSFLGLDGS